MKEEERKHSLDIILKKEQSARDTYNRKLKMDEQEREENEKKILSKCKKIKYNIINYSLFNNIYYFSGII